MKEFCAYLKNKLINSTYENSKTLINLDEEYEKYSKMKNELTNNIPSDKSKKKIKEFCEYLKRKLLNSNNQTAINIKFSMENKMIKIFFNKTIEGNGHNMDFNNSKFINLDEEFEIFSKIKNEMLKELKIDNKKQRGLASKNNSKFANLEHQYDFYNKINKNHKKSDNNSRNSFRKDGTKKKQSESVIKINRNFSNLDHEFDFYNKIKDSVRKGDINKKPSGLVAMTNSSFDNLEHQYNFYNKIKKNQEFGKKNDSKKIKNKSLTKTNRTYTNLELHYDFFNKINKNHVSRDSIKSDSNKKQSESLTNTNSTFSNLDHQYDFYNKINNNHDFTKKNDTNKKPN